MPKKRPHEAEEFHYAYLDAIQSQMEPVPVLTEILRKKLLAQGIDTCKHMEAIIRTAERMWAAMPNAEQSEVEVEIGDEITGVIPVDVNVDIADLGEALEEISKKIESNMEDVFESLSESALRSVLQAPDARLLDRENERYTFTRRLALTWAEPFKLFRIQVALSEEIGAVRNDWLRKRCRRSKDLPVVEAITRLHGRAIQVAEEVQVLLSNGFADGALSRWRTIHELTVTAVFIFERGPTVAERYLAHHDAETVKAARQYEQFAGALQHKPISAREKKCLENLKARLERKYGKPFLTDYGWAADTLNNPKPTFTNIEEAIKLDHLRPYFKLASQTIHAGAKGIFFRLGLLGDQDIILTGSSNVGLQEAGRLTALSLAQITMVLLLIRANTDSIVWSKVIRQLSLKVEQEFVRVQRHIEREERKLQKKVTRVSKKDLSH